MKRRSPPWGAIEAFIAGANATQFKEAAERLGLSPSAFSRRVQALEDHVGVQLFDRTSPIPLLTSAGEEYVLRLQPGYEALRAATDWMTPDSTRRPLRLGVSQSFAASWLVPRLHNFYGQQKHIDLSLRARASDVDLLGGKADLGILYGCGDWEHLVTQKLFDLTAFVVCAPELIDGAAPPRHLEDLVQHRLLEASEPPNMWEHWFRLAGREKPTTQQISFDGMNVVYEAAARGLGVALGVSPLVDPFLREGRLQIAFELTLPLPGAYFVAALPTKRRAAEVGALWTWLMSEAAVPKSMGLVRTSR